MVAPQTLGATRFCYHAYPEDIEGAKSIRAKINKIEINHQNRNWDKLFTEI